jgi:hypothetical protein
VKSAFIHATAIAMAAAMVLCDTAGAQEVETTWDPDLSFDFDRAHYQEMLQQIVTQGYAGATGYLGMTRNGSLRVFIYSKDHYEKVFGEEAGRRRGAHYSRNAIYVNGGNRLDDRFAGELAHEMTHAVLDTRGTAGRLPAWFNEGLAERVGWAQRGLTGLTSSQAAELKGTAEHGELPPLQRREPLSSFGYLESYAAVLFLEHKAGKAALLRVTKKTLEGESFDAALREETHWSTTSDFERALAVSLQEPPE